MRPRSHIFIALATLTLLGCEPERRPPLPYLFTPPEPQTPDAPPDQVGPIITPDSRCAGALEGARCELPGATGVCVAGGCQRLACLASARDCDEEPMNGCERDISVATSCGACDRACDEAQTCQLGTTGFVCGAGVVCGRGRFDLDRDLATGCEWAVGAEAVVPGVLAKFTMSIAARAPSGALFVAGMDDQARFISAATTALADAAPLASLPAATPLALDASDAAGGVAVALWSDALAWHQPGVGELGRATPTCAGQGDQARFVSAALAHDPAHPTRAVVATTSGVAWLDPATCALDPQACLRDAPQQIGSAQYLRAFAPSSAHPALDARWLLRDEELEACIPCGFSLQAEDEDPSADALRCHGASQCRADGFDTTACGACGAQGSRGCPDLSPVALAVDPASSRLAVITRRGLLVLDARDGAPQARLETPFDPGVTTGAAFIGGTIGQVSEGESWAVLLHNRGYARVVAAREDDQGELILSPASPDLGLPLDFNAPSLSAHVLATTRAGGLIVVHDGRDAVVIAPRLSGASFHVIRDPEGVSSARLIAVTASPNGDGLSLWRERFNQLGRQDITYQVDDEMSAP